MIEVEAGGTIYEFPDGMSDDEIKAVLDKEFAQKPDLGFPASPRGASEWSGVSPDRVKELPFFRGADDLARSVASGVTFNFADEIAGGMNTLTGLGPSDTLSGNIAAERTRDASIDPGTRLLGEAVGAIGTGTGLARGGLSLLKNAKPTITSLMSRGAGEGAIYGGLFGAGHGEGVAGKATGAMTGAGLGALTGGVTAPVAGAVARRLSKPTAPTIDTLRKEAKTAYSAAEDAGVLVSQPSFKVAVGEISDAATKAGIDKTIHPSATAALKRLEEVAGPQTIEKLDILRRVIKGAASSNSADERRIAGIMIDKLDDYMVSLKPKDVSAGNAMEAVSHLNKARNLWSRFRKGETIQEAITRAENRAAQFSGSGMENALRTEFRAIAQNPKRLRVFSKEEQDAIIKVARGGPLANAMRMLGKFAPRGVVSTALDVGLGYSLGGPAGVAAVAGLGETGRQTATALTKESARLALERALTGKGPVTLSPEQAALLRSIIVGEQAATQ